MMIFLLLFKPKKMLKISWVDGDMKRHNVHVTSMYEYDSWKSLVYHQITYDNGHSISEWFVKDLLLILFLA